MAITDIRSAELEIPSRGPAGIPGPSGDEVNLDTRAVIGVTTVAPSAGFIRTAGKTAVGDGGGKVYARVGAEPTHADKAQSVDGAWWEGAQETEYEDVYLKHFLRRHDNREDGLREAFRAIAAEPSQNRLRLIGDGYQVPLRQPLLMRYDDGNFNVSNEANDGAIIDHVRLVIDGSGSHTWASGDYGLSLAGSGIDNSKNIKNWIFRNLEIDAQDFPVIGLHAAATADLTLDHYVGKNFSHVDSIGCYISRYIRDSGIGYASGAGWGSGHGFKCYGAEITGGVLNPGWALRLEVGDVEWKNCRFNKIRGVWTMGGFQEDGNHYSVGAQDTFFKRHAIYVARVGGTYKLGPLGEWDHAFIEFDTIDDPLGEGFGTAPAAFSDIYIAGFNFTTSDSVPPLTGTPPAPKGLITFNARAPNTVLRHFEIQPDQAGIVGYDGDPAHLPIHIVKFLSNGEHNFDNWDPASLQAGRMNLPTGSNVVSGVFPGRMAQQLFRFHNAAGLVHEGKYDINHPLGPGLTLSGTATVNPGYIGMSTDIMVFGTNSLGRLEITGSGAMRPGSDAALSFGSSSRQWLDAYFSGGIYQSGTPMLAGSGSPEGIITAPPGALYRRTNGGLTTSLYVKRTGSGNTGWVAVRGYLEGTTVSPWSPGSIASGAQATNVIPVTGAAIGMEATAFAVSVGLSGLHLSAYVNATDSVTIVLANLSGGPVTLASSHYKARVS